MPESRTQPGLSEQDKLLLLELRENPHFQTLMAQAPRTRSRAYRPSMDNTLDELAYYSGIVKGEENIINFLLGESNG